MMTLNKRVVLVSGASRGIGYALVKRLLDEGAVVVACARTMCETSIAHERLTKIDADVAVDGELDRVFNEAIMRHGTVDAFVANAGFAYYERLNEPTTSHIDDIFHVNVHHVIRGAARMKQVKGEEPFNVMVTSSGVAFVQTPGYALYSATKAALEGFIGSYRHELARGQVIQAVYPIATETAFFDRANQPHRPWPVQSADRVAKAMVRGLKKNKKRIYPLPLFPIGRVLTPWFFTWYVRREKKRFDTHHSIKRR